MKSFDVTQLPIDLVVQITLPVLQRLDQSLLDEAIDGIRSRFLSINKAPAPVVFQPSTLPPTALEEDDEDYEPDFEPREDAEQILNGADGLPSEDSEQVTDEVALGPFKLPQPPPLTQEETVKLGKGTISRVFSMMNILDNPAGPSKRQKPGLHRLAGSNYDREAWITVITRLATRAQCGLAESEGPDKSQAVKNGTVSVSGGTNLSNGIRETLWKYIIEDFRARIPIAIAWLNEEWYNDQVRPQATKGSHGQNNAAKNYEKWVLKVMDGIVPYLDAKDKVLIRFLSEIPVVNEKLLERVKGLARDPERVTLAVNALQ